MRTNNTVTEDFEAIIFADGRDGWTIVERARADSFAVGLGWARGRLQHIATQRVYRRFRARVLSSTDEQNAEGILRELKKAASDRAAGINCGARGRAPRVIKHSPDDAPRPSA